MFGFHLHLIWSRLRTQINCVRIKLFEYFYSEFEQLIVFIDVKEGVERGRCLENKERAK